MIDLRLHRMEEGLDEGVIGDLAGTVHALSEAQFGDSLLEGASSVFDAPVGVEHQLRAGSAAAHGAVERLEREPDVLPSSVAPAHDAATVLHRRCLESLSVLLNL